MAIVREIVTLLRYDVDKSGLNEYVSALKSLAGMVAGLFAAHEIMDTADEWTSLRSRVVLATEGIADQTKAMDGLYQIARTTGQTMESLGSLFVQIGMSRKELNLTTEDALKLTESIGDLLMMGGRDKGHNQAAIMQIDEALSMGHLQTRHLQALMMDSPMISQFLRTAAGGADKLMEMAHAGKLSAKWLTDAFLNGYETIKKSAAGFPITFGMAFRIVNTELGKLLDEVGQSSHIWTTLTTIIVESTRAAFDGIRWIANQLGGFNNLLETTGIVMIAAFGPSALAMLGRFVMAVRGITLASIAAAAPWYLLAGLILAIGLAVQDVWTWMSGGQSVTEDLIGPWSEWRDTVEDWRTSFKGAWKAVTDQFDESSTAVHQLGVEIFGLKEKWTLGTLLELYIGQLQKAVNLIRELKNFFSSEKPQVGESVPRSDASMWLESKGVPRGLLGVPEDRLDTWWTPKPTPAAPEESSGIGLPQWIKSMLGVPAAWNDAAVRGPLVPPTALIPPGAQTTNTSVNAPITVNLTTASDTPQAVGDAAAKGVRTGIADGLGRSLGLASPQTEFGLGY